MNTSAENRLRNYGFTDDEILEIAVSERLMDTAGHICTEIWVRNNYIRVPVMDCAFLIKKLKQELA